MHNLKKALYCLAIVFVAFFSAFPLAHALEITALRFGEQGTALRVVLDMTEAADFRATVESSPARVVIDLPMLSGNALIGRSALPRAITDIRLEPASGSHTRISLLLRNPATIRTAFLIPAEGGKPNRLVIDLTPASAEAFARQTGRVHGTLRLDTPAAAIDKPAAPGALPFATGTAGIRLGPVLSDTPDLPKAEDTSLPLIMLDAGHGGQDSGAVGHNLQEKDITLAVTLALKEALEATGKYRVALTRDSDTFVRLQERVRMARAAQADLFVSIHADSVAHGGHTVQGASFYTLSAQASDASAARLAARENKADTLSGIELPGDDHDVKTILIDLAMRETTAGARKFARALSDTFRKAGIKTIPAPHRSAGFLVLQAPDIPSVLVEMGFLSNAKEAEKLADTAYRARLGDTIARAIDAYFSSKPE